MRTWCRTCFHTLYDEKKSKCNVTLCECVALQYKLALSALDESIQVEQMASVADQITDLLSILVTTVPSVKEKDSDMLTEILKAVGISL